MDILFQDSFLVAVNKPAGLLVHRTQLDWRESDSAVQQLQEQLGVKVYPVHRLDRPTSGVLVFALAAPIARTLSKAFMAKQVNKSYLAVVRGFAPAETTVDHPLKEELDPIADRSANPDKAAQDAVTEVTTLDQVELPFKVDRFPTSRYSLVRAKPITGRKHQVRRHLRHLGHPIVGDVNHGSGKHNRFFRDQYGVSRLLLACESMSFDHPVLPKRLHITAALCDQFLGVLQTFHWESHATPAKN